jgi:hypothetical protein
MNIIYFVKRLFGWLPKEQIVSNNEMPIEVDCIKINNYTVYDNQIKAARSYFMRLINKQLPVLCSQPQMGKTGVLIYTVAQILEYAALEKINNFSIIHVINDNAIVVKEQTINDYKDAFGNGHAGHEEWELFYGTNPIINVAARQDLKKIKLDPNTIYFILDDECHVAMNIDGQFASFYEQFNTINTYIGFCSATPFPHNIKHQLSKHSYIPIALQPSDIFYGIDNYYDDNRIKQSEYLFDGKKLSDFAKSVFLPDIIEKIKTNGNGYVILRDQAASEKDYEKLIKFMQPYGIDCEYKCFNSTEKNIKEISAKLNSKPKRSELIIIKGALRLGKRLTKTYIRGMCDTPKSQSDAAVIQSLLGRGCGNDVNNKDFNVYCDLGAIGDYIDWWRGVNIIHNEIVLDNSDHYKLDMNNVDGYQLTIPSSQFNKSNVKEHSPCEIYWYDTYQDAFINLQKYDGAEWWNDEWHKKEWKGQVSKNTSKDIAKHILDKGYPNQKSCIYLIDAQYEKFSDSWNNLLRKYPDCENRWILFIPSKTLVKNVGIASKNDIKDTTYLK